MKNCHPNKKFHSTSCKDSYWNRRNPRGFASPSNKIDFVGEDAIEDYDLDHCGYHNKD